MAIVYLGLGSNKGDRIGYVQQAASLLGMDEGISIVRTSAFYETEPWGMNSDNWFVNAVVEIKTSLPPQKPLEECQRIERQLGRKQSDKGSGYTDRTIDIDILFFGKETIDCPRLTIPHKNIADRPFVMEPLRMGAKPSLRKAFPEYF